VAFAASTDAPQRADVIAAGAPLVQERIATLREGVDMLRFLLVDEADFSVDEAAAAKQLGEPGQRVLGAALPALEAVADWTHEPIEAALRAALVDGLGLKPRHAFGPIRVAITGSTVSPPLFESMQILGGERSLARLRAAAAS
jgi:glutamyl-tRNA synthetase